MISPRYDSFDSPDPATDRAMHALSAEDARILDWLVEHGFDASKVVLLPECDRDRAMAIVRQMSALDAYAAPAPDEAVVDATLARIDRYEADREAALRIGSSGRPRIRLRLGDVLGIAALLMLSTAVLLPIASQVRANSLSTVCANNLRSLSTGLTAYASDFSGNLPMLAPANGSPQVAAIGGALDSFLSGASSGTAAAPDGHAMGARTTGAPGTGPRSSTAPQAPTRAIITVSPDAQTVRITPEWGAYRNSANLAILVANGYCDVHALQCPGCAKGTACFAYRVPTSDGRLKIETPKPMVLVADANPVIELRMDGRKVESSVLSSRNHSDRGQNMLFGDGAVVWTVSPVLTIRPRELFDNIWLPRDADGVEKSDLKCQNRDPADNFVAQ